MSMEGEGDDDDEVVVKGSWRVLDTDWKMYRILGQWDTKALMEPTKSRDYLHHSL